MFKASCPAKINLFLKITDRRLDGYHELESLFAFLDLSDELEVSKKKVILEKIPVILDSGGIEDLISFDSKQKLTRSSTLRVKDDEAVIEISGEFGEFIDPKNNLFTKILDFFAEEFGVSKNLHIKIKKNIPVGAGLGGGSSNAAYFMKALNEIFSLNLSKEKLQEISLNFGSDIAFFFEDQASIVKGRGEIIENFSKFKPLPALLVNPKISLSTKEVFEKLGQNFSTENPIKELLEKDVFELIKNFPNDLERPAISIVPVISEILNELKDCDVEIAKMSGSGATCFAIFKGEKKLAEAQKKLRKKFPEFFVKEVKILSHV